MFDLKPFELEIIISSIQSDVDKLEREKPKEDCLKKAVRENIDIKEQLIKKLQSFKSIKEKDFCFQFDKKR